MRLQLSEPAKEDLVEIWEYVAEENPDAARRLLETIRTKFEMLCAFPNSGRERNELIIGLRSFTVGKYVILYQVQDDVLEIVRVRHGSTDMDNLFDI